MAKHAHMRTDEQLERLKANRRILGDALSGCENRKDASTQSAGMTLALERIPFDRATGRPVAYDGFAGMESLLTELVRATYRQGEVRSDGRLVGVAGTLAIEGCEERVDLHATLGAGAQLLLAVGPARSTLALLQAIDVFDWQLHLASKALGKDLQLVAQGYNANVSSPSDIVVVPTARNVLMNAYLSRTGRYARDALRCTASTRLLLPVREREDDAVEDYRTCVALAPVLAFLTDNSLRCRGSDPHETPRMTRALMWDQLDDSRCGIVPGTFGDAFGFAAYERWVEGLRPILFTSAEGVSFSTGTDTCGRVMEERVLSRGEAHHLLSMAFPDVRWNGRLELRMADSLPPRLAGGYAALVKGLLAQDVTRSAVRALIGLDGIGEDDVRRAWHDLRELGWKARVFGRPVAQVADELAAIASRGLDDREERRLVDELSQLWEVRMVPRDMLVHNWRQTQARASLTDAEGDAAELYGVGAVMPYEELEGDPPAGQTAVIPTVRP